MNLKSLRLISFFCFLSIFFFAKLSYGAISEWKINEVSGAQTRILASSRIDNGTRKILVGVEFKLKEGWKIYGENSQDVGMPPIFDFGGSSNFKQYEISWPKAHEGEEKIGDQTYKYSYYSDKITIPLILDLKDQNAPFNLKLNLRYGICKDVCVPVEHDFEMMIDGNPDCEAFKEIQKFLPITSGFSEQEFEKIDMSLPNEDKNQDQKNSLFLMLMIAVLGGAILNIMPCVLPVLSIKLLSIIDHSRAKKSKIRLSFLSTIIGILSGFVGLAFVASLIKKTGNSLGWGFQFQNPYFLISLILILTFLIADLIGYFEISFNQFLANFLNNKIIKSESRSKIFVPNYLSGILAVMLATPCSAPFLGSAISFALSQNFSIIFLIFLAIGIGFALPYFVLIISPNLLKFLPKPGPWMIKVKQLMAGLLIATLVWLVCVLVEIIGIIPALLIAAAALGLFVSMKIKNKIVRFFLIAAMILIAITLPFKIRKMQIAREEVYGKNWQQFDETTLYRLVNENKVVLIDITADWCITCKFNKIMVLRSKEIVKMLEDREIIGMRADITKPDDAVMNFLKKHNRFAIPFNAVYGPKIPQGHATSELLNKKELLELLNGAK